MQISILRNGSVGTKESLWDLYSPGKPASLNPQCHLMMLEIPLPEGEGLGEGERFLQGTYGKTLSL
jgi:hypothetical protein